MPFLQQALLGRIQSASEQHLVCIPMQTCCVLQVAFPKDSLLSTRERLTAIKEKDTEAAESEGQPGSPASSVANSSHTAESAFAEAAYKGNLPGPVSGHASKAGAPGSPWASPEEREGQLTAGAFGQQSLSAQRHLRCPPRIALAFSLRKATPHEQACREP